MRPRPLGSVAVTTSFVLIEGFALNYAATDTVVLRVRGDQTEELLFGYRASDTDPSDFIPASQEGTIGPYSVRDFPKYIKAAAATSVTLSIVGA